MTWLRHALGRWEVFLLFVLVAIFICGSQVSQYFLTSSNISIALAGMMPVAIIAVPMTLIIITGEIDISVGSMVGLSASSMAVCLERGFPVEAAMLVGVVVGTLAGLFNGTFVVFGKLPSLVVTIGTLALYRGIAQIILKERGVSGFPDWYQNLGFGTIYGTPIPWSLVIFLLFFVWFAIFLHRTHWGRALYAIGNNREAARFSGINVNRAILRCLHRLRSHVFVGGDHFDRVPSERTFGYRDRARTPCNNSRRPRRREHLRGQRHHGRRPCLAPRTRLCSERAGPCGRDA